MSTTKVTIDSNKFIDVLRRKATNNIVSSMKESINMVAETARKYAYPEVAEKIQVSDVKVTKVVDGLNFTVSAFVLLDDVPWARAVEFGSGLHDPDKESTISIDAKDAPALVFWWEKRDTLFVGQHVNHPGVRARPYLTRALKEHKQRILQTLKARINGK